MTYYADSDANGNIIAYYSDEINSSIPSTAIQITDEQWQDSVNNIGKYMIQNGALVTKPPPSDDELLVQSQQGKISDLRNSYNQCLLNGFNVTIGSNTYTLGWSTDDKANLNATQTAVDRSYQTFPILYADINGSPITLSSQSDLDTIEQTATKFAFAQHQQILNLVGQVQSTSDTSTVNSISWTPATY